MRPILLVPLLLIGCGPVSPEAAARMCEQEARAARGPTGVIYGGATSDGPRAGAQVTVSTDYLLRRDPMQVYDSCVRRKSGQGPIRPPDFDKPTRERIGHW